MKLVSKGTPWYQVYHEIALKLQRFYKKHHADSGPILFKLLNESSIYRKNNSWLSNTKRIRIPSIEPIQLFVSFSRSRQNEEIRKDIINEVVRLLDPKERGWARIDFGGCPTPLAIKLQYVRPEPVQNEIWKAFNNIMKNGRDALTQSIWNQVKTWRGIQIPSFTIFLFWIRSDDFLPLDKNTKLYLERAGVIKDNVMLTLGTYLNLLNNNKIGSYTKVSLEAYFFNNRPEDFENYLGLNTLIANLSDVDTQFRLIGLRTLKRHEEVHKILKPFEYYSLDHAITPQLSDTKKEAVLELFRGEPIKAETLYNLPDLKVNITAIVGKNGSGKSTLFDLVMMGIYNLSIELGYLKKTESPSIENLNFEIYWHTDTLYKLSFSKEVLFYRFQDTTDEGGTKMYTLNNEPLKLENLKSNFFYSILVNYSHYALNSNDYAVDWITPLSHKNDGYKTPLVINPKRTKGDIEINTQKDLLNMRLLLNLLELHDHDIPKQSFRYIDNDKHLKYFSIFYDEEKQNEKIEEAKKRVLEDPKIIPLIFDQVTNVFNLNLGNQNELQYIESIKHYLFNKMLTIVERYDRYKDEYEEGLNFFIEQNVATTIEMSEMELRFLLANRITDLLEELKVDRSHITLKFKQVINYLKYPKLRKLINDAIESKSFIELDKYEKLVNDIINLQGQDITVAELLPPPIFKLDFHLDDAGKSSFSKASSGEYQLISVLSTVLYHIRNIDSVEQAGRYNYVMVLLDEIELYFHPNMQRLFIKKLLEALSKLDIELYGVHVLFSTHSPFILSDIQQQKILKIKNGNIVQREDGYNTFAANIHDLLADEFFLADGFMGAFAQRKIETTINLLNYIKAHSELENLPINDQQLTKEQKFMKKKLKNDKNFYEQQLSSLNYWNGLVTPENLDIEVERERLYAFIEIIGEPLIKERLRSMFRSTFSNILDIENANRNEARERISQLMKQYNFAKEDFE